MLRASVLYLLTGLLLLSGCGQKGPLYREAPPQEPGSEETSQSRTAGDDAPPQD